MENDIFLTAAIDIQVDGYNIEIMAHDITPYERELSKVKQAFGKTFRLESMRGKLIKFPDNPCDQCKGAGSWIIIMKGCALGPTTLMPEPLSDSRTTYCWKCKGTGEA